MSNQDYWIFDDSARPIVSMVVHQIIVVLELLDSGIILVNKPSGPTSHQLMLGPEI